MRYRHVALLPLILATLSSCGGSDASPSVVAPTPPPPPPPPVSDPGARIVFSREPTPGQTDIYLIREDGSGEIALANSTDPENFMAFTTDGRIIYERFAGPPPGVANLYSVKLDGTDRQILSATDGDQLYGLTKTNKVIFTTSTPQRGLAINAINPDGTQRVVLSDTADDEHIEALTASGRVIYSTQNATSTAVNSINPDGTGRVTFDVAPNATGCNYTATAGTKVALECSFANRGSDVFTVSESGGALTPIATDPALDEYVMSATKGGQLVIARYDGQADQVDLYLANVDGGALVSVATPAAREIPVTSTTNRFVFVAYDTPNNYDTKSVRLDGTGLVSLQPPTEPLSLRFLTPSEKLVFQWFRGATKSDLLAINADGTGAITLASSPADDNFLAADDTRVIYQSIENNQIGATNSVNIATAATTLLVPAGSELRYAQLLPSGRVLLRKPGTGATPDDDIFIVNADGTGTKPLVQTTARENVSGVIP